MKLLKPMTQSFSSSTKAYLLASALLFSGVACTSDEGEIEDLITTDANANQKLPDHVKNQNNKFTVDDLGKVKFEAEIVYFKFDDSSLTDEGRSRLSAMAEFLSANPAKVLQVRGHCDERGSTEYNLALGQIRSQSVRTYLLNLGLDQKRISAISFGEEKPAVVGHSEEAWSKNRRADFLLTNG